MIGRCTGSSTQLGFQTILLVFLQYNVDDTCGAIGVKAGRRVGDDFNALDVLAVNFEFNRLIAL